LALLAVGFLYLGKFEASLIGQQIESLHTQGEIFAAALSEGAVLDSTDEGEILLPDLARQMMRRLVEPTRTRAACSTSTASRSPIAVCLRGPGDAVQVTELPPVEHKGPVVRLIDRIYDWSPSWCRAGTSIRPTARATPARPRIMARRCVPCAAKAPRPCAAIRRAAGWW